MNTENVDKFRKMYVDFERLTKNKLEDDNIEMYDAIRELKKKRISPYYQEYEFLQFCRDCRNRISHVNDDYKYIIYTDSFVEKFEKIINQIKIPITVYEKATKPVIGAKLTDNVKEVMGLMAKNNYTHVPVYDGNSLIGIFSEGCIFNYLYNNSKIEIDDNITFSDLKECINLDNSSELVKFKSRKSLYDDVINEFIRDYLDGKRLSCIMITENGNCSEKVIGIITAWDIIGKDTL